MEPIIIIVAAALLVYGVVWARHDEIKRWNGGRCRTCAAPLALFDYDSQGGRGYKCSAEGHGHGSVWISYNIERGIPKEEPK